MVNIQYKESSNGLYLLLHKLDNVVQLKHLGIALQLIIIFNSFEDYFLGWQT